jgi:hypothetical protein
MFRRPGCKKLARSYLDARDLGQITWLCIETASDLPTRELLERCYRKGPARIADLGEYETPLANRKAKPMLGFAPEHSRRNDYRA